MPPAKSNSILEPTGVALDRQWLQPFAVRLVLSMVIAAITISAVFKFFNPGFETNDDVGMMRIVSGQVTGQPDPHLLFQHIFIGKALVWAYETWPRVNWYVWHMYGSHFLALTALLLAGFGGERNGTVRFLYFFGVLLFESYFLLYLQFTTTAFVVGVAGWTWLLRVTPGWTRRNLATLIVALGFLMLSVMIRRPSFLLSSAIFGPAVLLLFFRSGVPRRQLAMWFAVVAIPLALPLADKYHYRSDPDWRAYGEYKRLHGAIENSPGYDYLRGAADAPNPEYDEVLKRINWNQNDGHMFVTWFFTDQEVFSPENLEQLADVFRNDRRQSVRGNAIIFDGLKLRPYLTVYTVAVAMAMLVVGARSRQRWVFLTQGLTTALILGLLVYLAYFSRLPLRVVVCLLFALGHMGVMFLLFSFTGIRDPEAQRNASPTGVLRWLAPGGMIGLALATAIWTAADSHRISGLVAERQATYVQLVELLSKLQTREGRPVASVIWGYSMGHQFCPVEFFTTDRSRQRMIIVGGKVSSPLYQAACRRFEVTDMIRDLTRRDDLILLAFREFLPLMQRFVMDHYGERIKFNLIPIFPKESRLLAVQLILVNKAP